MGRTPANPDRNPIQWTAPGAFILGAFLLLASLGNGARAAGKAYTIRIEHRKFIPAQLTAETGDTVVWENHDSVAHAIHRLDDGDPALDSGRLAPGAAFSFRVRGIRSIPYGSRSNPKMHGNIDIINPD